MLLIFAWFLAVFYQFKETTSKKVLIFLTILIIERKFKKFTIVFFVDKIINVTCI